LSETFRCGFRRVPISLGYSATAVDKLARNARRAILSLFIQDLELNFRNGLADRSRPDSDLVGWQPGRPKCFGQSVHEHNIGPWERSLQLVKHSRSYRSASGTHVA